MSKSIHNLVLVVMLLLAVSVVSADGMTLIQRVETSSGSPASFTTAVVTPDGWEFWACTWNTFPDYEVGKLFPVRAKGTGSLALGGYVAWWEKTGEWFLEPVASYSWKSGAWNGNACVGAYVPLNGKTWVVFSPETSLTTLVSKGFSAGPALSYWNPSGSDEDFRVGGVVKYSAGSVTVKGRYLFGTGGDEDTARFQVSVAY